MQKVVFSSASNTFYATLRREVDDYFATQKISKNGNIRLYAKTIIFLSVSVLLYTWLVFFTPDSGWLSLFLCVLCGLNMSFIGFNIMHDASHGSYSASGRVCNILSYSMNYLGSVIFFWNTKHNILHHTYTNIDGVDADIVQTSLLRLAPTQKWRPIHRFQHIYAPVLYALAHATWIYQNDFEKYFTRKVLNMPIKNFGIKEHFIFWITKILYTLFYLVIPVMVVGPWALAGFAVISLVCGFTLTIVFQLAHVVEITDFEDGTNGIEVENEWAVHQVNTTADFAVNNKVISWFLGGLNFQAVHHLFPKISHIHYPAIQKIMEKCCREHGVKYRSFKTMGEAVASHLRFMRDMGQPDYVHRVAVISQ